MRSKPFLTLVAVVLAAVAAPMVIAAPQQQVSEETLKVFKGKVTFRIYCSNCHGDAGRGDGSLAELLTVAPADLTVIARDNGGVFPRERITKLVDGRETAKGHGRKEMPIWGDAFQKSLRPTWSEETDEQRASRKIEEVVAFVESLQELEAPAAE